jgi:CHAD domain-containing protein
VKARTVKVDPDAPFVDTLLAILAVRLDELFSFEGAGDDQGLHHMRIAAKRVRYVLEVGAPVVPGALARMNAAKRVQDLLGEIHDCDELLPLIGGHVEGLRAEDDVAAAAGAALPNRRKYRGLEALRAHTVARRIALCEQFAAEWPKLRRRLEAPKAVTA